LRTTTVTALMPALRDKLIVRPLLSGIAVSTGPLADSVGLLESIEFGSLEQTQEYNAIGNKRKKEDYTLHGWIIIADYGADEETIVAVRNRAYDLLAELEDCLALDPTVNGTVLTATLTNHRLTQFITGETGNQRGVSLEFDISVKATLTRS
jgi:hypothetical protein